MSAQQRSRAKQAYLCWSGLFTDIATAISLVKPAPFQQLSSNRHGKRIIPQPHAPERRVSIVSKQPTFYSRLSSVQWKPSVLTGLASPGSTGPRYRPLRSQQQKQAHHGRLSAAQRTLCNLQFTDVVKMVNAWCQDRTVELGLGRILYTRGPAF